MIKNMVYRSCQKWPVFDQFLIKWSSTRLALSIKNMTLGPDRFMHICQKKIYCCDVKKMHPRARAHPWRARVRARAYNTSRARNKYTRGTPYTIRPGLWWTGHSGGQMVVGMCQNDTDMTTPKHALRRTLAAPNSLNDAGRALSLIFKNFCG